MLFLLIEKILFFIVNIIFILLCIAILTLIERKVMSSAQRGRCPNITGLFGFVQPFADGLKLVLKERIVPSNSNFYIFLLSPVVTFFFTICIFLMVPFSPGYIILESPFSIILLLAISSLIERVFMSSAQRGKCPDRTHNKRVTSNVKLLNKVSIFSRRHVTTKNYCVSTPIIKNQKRSYVQIREVRSTFISKSKRSAYLLKKKISEKIDYFLLYLKYLLGMSNKVEVTSVMFDSTLYINYDIKYYNSLNNKELLFLSDVIINDNLLSYCSMMEVYTYGSCKEDSNLFFIYDEYNEMYSYYYVVDVIYEKVYYENKHFFITCVYYLDFSCFNPTIKPDEFGNYAICLQCGVSFGNNDISNRMQSLLVDEVEKNFCSSKSLELKVLLSIKNLNKIDFEKYFEKENDN